MKSALRYGCVTLALLAGVSVARAADLPSESRQLDENPTVLRLNLGAGLTYEFQTLNSVLLTGSGPSAEINLEFVTAKRRSWGVGARYRRISLLGPDVSAAGATIEQISNIDYNIFLRFGWLDLYGGVEQFTGKMFVIDSGSSGSMVSESKLGLRAFSWNRTT